jgi:hypothetical protein
MGESSQNENLILIKKMRNNTKENLALKPRP